MSDLVYYNAARSALAKSHSIDEVKPIRDKAMAMQLYAQQANDSALIDYATEIRYRAEIRGGEILREMKTNGERDDGKGNRNPGLKSQAVTPKLSDLGVSKMQSSRWQRLAALTETEQDKRIEIAKQKVRAVIEGTNVRGTQGTGENEWFTPPEFIELARKVLGEIDLDPATHERAQEIIRANSYFTKSDNSLTREWCGRVWLNPPYAQPLISQFVDKFCEERGAGRITAAILLTHNYTDTAWFQKLASWADAVCFTRGRVKFYEPDGETAAPTQGQAFSYFGPKPADFVACFAAVGFVMRPVK